MINKLFLSLLVFTLLNAGLNAQTDNIRMFIFGHSLIDHRPPAIPTPSNETTVPHWVYLLAETAGQEYAAGGQYGFLPQHANVPPIAQWGYDIVPGVWESDTEPFSAADISTVLLTAGNFMQWQAPTLDYPSDPGVSPVSATETILDWVTSQEESAKFYIYENWPDMAPYLGAGFPPSPTEFANYNAYVLADFHDWWLTYQDELLAAQPAANIRMVPVGPIITKILTDALPVSIPLTELYEDDAPHGRASLYFLAGLVTYMAVYETPAPLDFSVPAIVHPVIADNYTDLVPFVWNELLDFNDESGKSRVFCADVSTATVEAELRQASSEIVPNPNNGQFQITGNFTFDQIEVLTPTGSLIQRFDTVTTTSHTIDVSHLAAGLYIVKLSSEKRAGMIYRNLFIGQ